MCEIIYTIVIDHFIISNNRFKKIFFEITIFAAKKKNLIANSNSRYEIIAFFKRSFIVFFVLINLSKESLIYIRLLSISIFRNLIIIFIMLLM